MGPSAGASGKGLRRDLIIAGHLVRAAGEPMRPRVGTFRTASLMYRALFGALLAMLLAARLLSPVGFMPSFGHGLPTIVACPDYDPAPAPAHHHHGPKKQQQCPYAAGNAAAAPVELALLAVLLLVGAASSLGRPFSFLERHRAFERPPSRGPPVSA
jgi:hypothetical protein